MRCLRCQERLAPRAAGRKATAHECPGGHGALVLGDHAHHVIPVAPLARLHDSMRGAPEGPHGCPACGATMRLARALRHGADVVVDACGACGALWFDAGELDALRAKERGSGSAPAAAPEGARALAGESAAVVTDPFVLGGVAELIGALLDS